MLGGRGFGFAEEVGEVEAGEGFLGAAGLVGEGKHAVLVEHLAELLGRNVGEGGEHAGARVIGLQGEFFRLGEAEGVFGEDAGEQGFDGEVGVGEFLRGKGVEQDVEAVPVVFTGDEARESLQEDGAGVALAVFLVSVDAEVGGGLHGAGEVAFQRLGGVGGVGQADERLVGLSGVGIIERDGEVAIGQEAEVGEGGAFHGFIGVGFEVALRGAVGEGHGLQGDVLHLQVDAVGVLGIVHQHGGGGEEFGEKALDVFRRFAQAEDVLLQGG